MRQRSMLWLIHLTLGSMVATAAAQDRPVDFTGERALVFAGTPGQALTSSSTAPAPAIVARFLKEHHVSAATLGSLRVVSETHNAPSGLIYLRFQQEVAGLRVPGSYVKAALSEQGELIHLIQNIAEVSAQHPASARVDEQAALRTTLHYLYPDLGLRPAFVIRQGNLSTFSKDAFFYAAPTVEKVAIAMTDGTLKVGFVVETWTQKGNSLNETLNQRRRSIFEQ